MKDVHKAIEAVWKIESTRLIAAIARVTHDIGIAEELTQDALMPALELWPEEGIPECIHLSSVRYSSHLQRKGVDIFRL
jgi:predicted RNA polymerase sigma factor